MSTITHIYEELLADKSVTIQCQSLQHIKDIYSRLRTTKYRYDKKYQDFEPGVSLSGIKVIRYTIYDIENPFKVTFFLGDSLRNPEIKFDIISVQELKGSAESI